MEGRYIQLTRITLVALFLVVAAGSIVRMTGSGMGCPDWPKCFGKWIPPTDIGQLPENYKEVYSDIRAKKIQRFTKLLENIGFGDEAEKIRSDKSLLVEEDFNASKTWTEYINRLVGAITGLLVLLSTLFALRFYRLHPSWFWISFLNLILIALTAWFGAVVVATNLLPWILTVHMLLAVALILSQVNLLTRVVRPRFKIKVSRGFKLVLFITIAATLAQIILGTQVRQEIDSIASSTGEVYREYWINWVSKNFLIHRSSSIALLLLTLWLIYKSAKTRYSIPLLNLVLVFMLFEVGLGATLNYLGMPKFAQPLHLILGTIIIALQYYIYRRTASK